MGETKTLKWFDSLKRRDFENGATTDEIREVFKNSNELQAKVERLERALRDFRLVASMARWCLVKLEGESDLTKRLDSSISASRSGAPVPESRVALAGPGILELYRTEVTDAQTMTGEGFLGEGTDLDQGPVKKPDSRERVALRKIRRAYAMPEDGVTDIRVDLMDQIAEAVLRGDKEDSDGELAQ